MKIVWLSSGSWKWLFFVTFTAFLWMAWIVRSQGIVIQDQINAINYLMGFFATYKI